MAMLCLLIEPAELSMENCALPLAQSVVRPVDIVTVKPLAGHAAAVVHGARYALDLIVVSDDDSTLSGGHELARLKTERPCTSNSPDRAVAPLGAMSVRAVLDERELVCGRNFPEPVEISGMASHVHGANCFRTGSNGGFHQFRINAVRGAAHINHHRHCGCKQYRAGCRDEGEIRNDDLVA